MANHYLMDRNVKAHIAAAEGEIKDYHVRRKELDKIKAELIPSPTVKYGASLHSPGGQNRTTESVTLSIMSSPRIAYLERIVDAVESVIIPLDVSDKKLLDLIYWKRTHTPVGAGQVVGMTKSTVYRHLDRIKRDVALKMGWISPEQAQRWFNF